MLVGRLVRNNLRLFGHCGSRLYCSGVIDSNNYLKMTNETLESINDRFSELIEDYESLAGGDTTLADGVDCQTVPSRNIRPQQTDAK